MGHWEAPEAKQGWLDKRGEIGLKQWQRRWFTLDESGVQYFLDKDLKIQKGSISLQSITSATSSTPPATELLLSSSGAYFQINTNEIKNNRIYYLYCESKEETTHWIIAINYWRDYASGSGFGPKDTEQQQKQPISPPQQPLSPVPQIPQNSQNSQNPQISQNPQAPQPYTPYPDPSLPSAPPPSLPSAPPPDPSPYHRYLEYERLQEISNPTGQTTNGTGKGSPHVHVYNAPAFTNNLPPYAPTAQLSVPVPPQPPRPLRTIDETACREILFTEGVNLKNYMDLNVACCSFLMQQDLAISGNGNEKRMHVLCAYLVLSSLDWDNRNTPATTYWCSPAYEADNIFQYFQYLVALARQEILDKWPMEGPTVVTQIDTWIKRKRKDHQYLVQKEDRDAFLKRNLAVLSYIRAGRLFDENSNALDACSVLIDRLLEAEEQLPHNRYGMIVWQTVGPSIAEKERPFVKQLLWAYLVFQKLKMEDDQIGFMARDPFVTNAFTTVLTMFHNTISIPSLAIVKRDIQSVMMKVFGTWQRDMPLLAQSLRGDALHLTQTNLRIVSRIMVKVMAFPQLYEAFQKLKTTIEQRITQEFPPGPNNTPFPSLPASNNVTSDDMNELGYVIRQALSNLYHSN